MIDFSGYDVMLNDSFPLWVVMLMVGFVISTVLFFTSKNDIPPVYHGVSHGHYLLVLVLLH